MNADEFSVRELSFSQLKLFNARPLPKNNFLLIFDFPTTLPPSLSLSPSHHVTPFSGVFTGLLLRVWFLFSSVDFRLLLNKQSVSKRASLQLAWPLFRKICPLLKLHMGNSAHTHTHTQYVDLCVCAVCGKQFVLRIFNNL